MLFISILIRKVQSVPFIFEFTLIKPKKLHRIFIRFVIYFTKNESIPLLILKFSTDHIIS